MAFDYPRTRRRAMPGSRDTTGGWYPQAAPYTIPVPNFSRGFTRRDAVVLHIIVGSQASARAKFQNPASRVSAHFSISKAGAVEQYVSVLDTAYGNGLSWNGQYWVDPEGAVLDGVHHPAPTWPKLAPPLNPNSQTISIEHEGQPSDTPTAAMAAARADLLRWLGAQFPSLAVYTPHQNLIGHYEISPANRPNCPGPNVDYVAIAQSGSQYPVYRMPTALDIFQRSDLTGPTAGQIRPGETVQIDARAPLPGYAPTAAHLADGRGFVDLTKLEAL